MTAQGAWPAEPVFDVGAAGCLEFLWPALPEALIGNAERRRIEAVALKLPAIGRLGLEMRLGAEEQGADLHQRLCANRADPHILRRYLSRAAEAPLSDPAIQAFLNYWADDTAGIRGDLPTLYLEWDCPAAGGPQPLPGVFLPAEPACASRLERIGRRAVVLSASERLHSGISDDVGAAFDLLAEAVTDGASLNYVGFMLGREGALRINVRGVRRCDLAPLLERIGWQGDLAAAARHFARLVDLCDRVIVGLDFAAGLQPRIGFEAVLDRQAPLEPRWTGLLDYLVGEGVCTQEKREALEALPASLYPEVEGQGWPASWIAAALLSPSAFVPWVERRVSHLKLIVSADGSLSAKAYVSAEHHWTRSVLRRRGRPSSNQQPDAVIAAASEGAIRFIVGAIGQDDLWRDFSMPGASDEWATAFIGWALMGTGDERARAVAQRSLEALLLRQRKDGGWGYNRLCASDADSTAWVLKFLQASQLRCPAMERARAFLLDHRLPDGGFATYAAGAQLRFQDADWNGSSEGWRSSHLCVAANAAAVLPNMLTELLRNGQSPDGYWRAYWWRTDVLATALALEAVAADDSGADAFRRGLAWARRQLPLARSAFDRAWLTKILVRGDGSDLDAARRVLTGLAEEQNKDGGWMPGAELLLPHPSQIGRREGLIPYLDVRGLFTTASVLAAATALRQGPPK